MFFKILSFIVALITLNNYNVKATSLIDRKYYDEVISEKFNKDLNSVYSAKTETGCPEAVAYAYGEKKASWDIEAIKKAAFDGNGIAQYCMYRELTKLYATLFNGEKQKACIEAAIWLICAIHRGCPLTAEDQLQWSDILPSDKENMDQVSVAIKNLAKLLAS